MLLPTAIVKLSYDSLEEGLEDGDNDELGVTVTLFKTVGMREAVGEFDKVGLPVSYFGSYDMSDAGDCD